MIPAFPNISPQPRSGDGQTPFVRSLGFVLLVLVALVLGNGHHHHHNDLQKHPDCAICATADHFIAETVAPISLATHLPELTALFAIPILSAVITRRTATLRSRAPPLT
jgi:hypothetical protein